MWSKQKAWEWYNNKPLIVGANFLPNSSVNSTSMWQKEAFDLDGSKDELSVAKEAGFNGIRVFLPYIVWEADATGLKDRMNKLLSVAWSNNINTVFILLDDCNFQSAQPSLGDQGEPFECVHNSRWTASPGWGRADDEANRPLIENYVKDIITTFRDDERIYYWELYNEPGNRTDGHKSMWLVEAAFDWARQCNCIHPLSIAAWSNMDNMPQLERNALKLSDIITFHCYLDIVKFKKFVNLLKEYERPIICTEWLHRPNLNDFNNHLTFMYNNKIASFCWGLFAGKTQTYLNWDRTKNVSSSCYDKSMLWQHDIFYPDGTPYNDDEIRIIRSLRGL